MSSFVTRKIRVTFQLADGTFDASSDSDTVILTDHRVICEIENRGGLELPSANIMIYGMSQELMNRLTVLSWKPMRFYRNKIKIEVGTSNRDMVLLFSGDTLNAQADYQGAPDVPFVVQAQAGFFGSLIPEQATTYKGSVKVSQIYSDIAKLLNVSFVNHGVDSSIVDQYLEGTPINRLKKLSRDTMTDYYFDGISLNVCPKDTPMENQDMLVLNANSGLIGWPSLDKIGVAVTALFNPLLLNGMPFKLESSVKPANGTWFIRAQSIKLESEKPGGIWLQHLLATETKYIG